MSDADYQPPRGERIITEPDVDTVITRIITFGYDHRHEIPASSGEILVFDYEHPCRITAPDPRGIAWDTFGNKWSTDYSPEVYATSGMGNDPRFVVVDLP